jgi:sigma-B regulation protein RsbU (phosphoserine phosphatase)
MDEQNTDLRETADAAASGSPEALPLLVADDEPVARALLVAHLRKAGYRVIEAENGRRALELARSADPALVLCDWRMPEMDGTDVCREIRQDPALRHLYFVMLTSLSDTDALVEALDAGADDYIQKPWDPRAMLARVRAGLRVATLQRELAQRTDDLTLAILGVKDPARADCGSGGAAASAAAPATVAANG